MKEPNYLDEAVKWFQLRPEGETIRWYSDHVGVDKPWSSSWIDVQIEELERDLLWNWTFSISSPQHDDDEDEPVGNEPSLNYIVAHDIHVLRLWVPELYWYADEYAIVKPIDIPFTEEERDQMWQIKLSKPGSTIARHEAWTAARITDWLDEWVAEVAERPDIEFGWDASGRKSPMLARAEEMITKIQSGEVKTIPFRDLVHKKDEGNGNG